MAQPSVDDLQSMFPQLPLTAIQDVVEQSGGADKALEVLLATTDGQRPSHSPGTVPLVSMQLVNVPASSPAFKPRPAQCVVAAHAAPKPAPSSGWVPPYLMNDQQFARHKSPPKSPRKKERHSGAGAGVLGILSSMHDVKAAGAAAQARHSVSPSCNVLGVQPRPQPQPQPAVLLPWQQAMSTNVCANCSSRSPSPSCQPQSGVVVLTPGVAGQPPAASPTGPLVSRLTSSPPAAHPRRVTSPCVLATPTSNAAGQHILALVSANAGAGLDAGALQRTSPCQQQFQYPYLQTPQQQPQQQQWGSSSSSGSSPRTPPPFAVPTPRGHESEPACPAATPPDVAQKVVFLRGMFGDLELPDAAIERVLATAGGDVEVAVNKLLQVQTSMDAAALSEESSSQASAEEASPEGRHENALACLRALYPAMEAAEVEGVLAAVGADVDAAVEVLADIQRQESAQLAADEALARRLQQQHQQQEPRAAATAAAFVELPVPRPCAGAATPSPPRSPAPGASPATPPPQQQQEGGGAYAWERQEEQRMVACRITLLRRMFDVQLERDMLEAMLADAAQDVAIVRDRLLDAGFPLRPGREPPRARAAAAGGAEAAVTDAELRAMREAAPGRARVAIHERTQALYDQRRAKAREWVELKRECMEAASHYFSKGQRDKAEALKLEGLRYGQLAYRENREASGAIYNQRNNTLSNMWHIDLHGLHIDEALDSVKNQIGIFSALPSHKRIKVITGRGAHSNGQEPKLYLAVRDYLVEAGYEYEAHLGHFVVHLPPPEEAAASRSSATASLPPSPGRASPGQASARRCRTQDDDELRHVRAPHQLAVPLSAYLRHAK